MSPHGTVRRYNAGCRCEPCRTERNAYLRAWRIRRAEQQPHGLSRYHNGCRCEVCRQASSTYERARYRATHPDARARGGAPAHQPLPRQDGAMQEDQEMQRRVLTHGTRHAYQVWRCRCAECRTANARYKAIQDRARAQARTSGVRHGTERRFAAGCLCELCVESHRLNGVQTQRVAAVSTETGFVPRPNQHPLKAMAIVPQKRPPADSWWTEQDRARFKARLEQERARLCGGLPDVDDLGILPAREVRFA